MKKLLLAGVAATSLFVGTLLPTIANAGEVTVVNRSSVPLVRFYARNLAYNELWNKRFEDNPIYPGNSRTFYFNTSGACGSWNLEVDHWPNHMTKAWDVDICGGARWTIENYMLGNAD